MASNYDNNAADNDAISTPFIRYLLVKHSLIRIYSNIASPRYTVFVIPLRAPLN